LSGLGTINGTVQNAGQLIVGDSTTTTGILTINGDYTQTATGTLAVKLGGTGTAGTDFDQLRISGNAMLGGTLQVTLIRGYMPRSGDMISILTCGLESGMFTDLTGDGPLFTPDYSTGVKLVAN